MNLGRIIVGLMTVTLLAGCRPEAPAEPTGRLLELNSEPAGATVLVDGHEAGQTPLQTRVDMKAHFVGVELRGHESAWRSVEPGTGSVTVEFRLRPATAVVIIESEPAGASVSLDDLAVGKTPVFLPEQAVGDYEVRFELAGYAPKSVHLELTDSRPKRVHATLGSVLGTLRVFSDPAGAAIYVDKVLRGNTPEDASRPLEITDMPEGEYTLVARHPGFHDQTQPFLLRRNETKTLRLPPMKELPGHLEVSSVPPGATVFRGEEILGKAPLTIKNLPRGTITLRFESEGFDPVRRTATISPGATTRMVAVMTKNVGSLALATEPPGCRIYVDNRLVGVTKPSANQLVSELFTQDGLAAGRHVMAVEHPRYYAQRLRFAIERGQVTRLGTLKLVKRWIPDYELKKKSGEVVRGILLQRRPDGSILFEHSKGIAIEYKKHEIEYLKPLELPRLDE